MQDDVVSTRSQGFGTGEPPLPHDEFLEDRGFSSYARGVYSGLDKGSRRATGYLSDQYQQQPIVLGAAAAAAVGAAAGVLIARSQIRRRKKTDAEKIADAVSAIPLLVASRIPSVDVEGIRTRGSEVLGATRQRGSEIAGEALHRGTDVAGTALHKGSEVAGAALHRGGEVLGATREMASTISEKASEKAPEMRRSPKAAGIAGDFRRTVRGGVGLVPIAVSMIRNPLIRDMIARAVTRSASRRRRGRR